MVTTSVMEPLTPNDPLWNLLGKTRKVGLRPNFAQNVVRAARQTPQDRGWLAGVKSWWRDFELGHAGLAWAAAAVIAVAGASFTLRPSAEVPQMAAAAAVQTEAAPVSADFMIPEFESEWQDLEQMGDLLVVNDTSVLTDREIQMLLY